MTAKRELWGWPGAAVVLGWSAMRGAWSRERFLGKGMRLTSAVRPVSKMRQPRLGVLGTAIVIAGSAWGCDVSNGATCAYHVLSDEYSSTTTLLSVHEHHDLDGRVTEITFTNDEYSPNRTWRRYVFEYDGSMLTRVVLFDDVNDRPTLTYVYEGVRADMATGCPTTFPIARFLREAVVTPSW